MLAEVGAEHDVVSESLYTGPAGERLAHAASGFSCARNVAGFELTGAGMDDGVPACGYRLPCELKGRACDERSALLSIAAIDDAEKRMAARRSWSMSPCP